MWNITQSVHLRSTSVLSAYAIYTTNLSVDYDTFLDKRNQSTAYNESVLKYLFSNT